MTKFKNKYRIESNRWRYWDYSNPGQYFITVCIKKRDCVLGKVVDQKMQLSPLGEIVKTEIKEFPYYHPRIILDEWTVMPNHIHPLIELGDYGFDNGMGDAPTGDGKSNGNGGDGNDNDNVTVNGAAEKIHEFSLPSSPSKPPQPKKWWHDPNYQPNDDEIKQYRKLRRKMLIPKIMGKLKMKTSKQINIVQNTPGKKNWQKDYHDHIIRDRQSYINIKNYIRNNPANWDEDLFYKH